MPYRDALRERDIDGTGPAILESPANMKGRVFEQSDEAALEAQETGGAHHGGLHEFVEFAGRTEFTGNFQDLVKLLGLGTRHAIQLGIGKGNGAITAKS